MQIVVLNRVYRSANISLPAFPPRERPARIHPQGPFGIRFVDPRQSDAASNNAFRDMHVIVKLSYLLRAEGRWMRATGTFYLAQDLLYSACRISFRALRREFPSFRQLGHGEITQHRGTEVTRLLSVHPRRREDAA